MIGKIISHYKILEKLGGGGMGVVYKAEDLKLKRFVALKFLPPEFTRDDEAKERFIHEAQAASALDHTNICTIHEIDETKPAPGEPGDGQMFIVMACYEGETLKKKIDRGPLSIREAVNFALQVARGLEKAHGQGIVHRDVKPANMMVTNDGLIKIVDFGLAKLAGRTKLTRAGSTLGTVAYMSPEQVRGEAVDQRADIWALGVILYEMLTGKLPFRGEYEQAVIYSILNEEPLAVEKLKPDVDPELTKIIHKMLAKSPGNRYQQIDEFISNLQNFQNAQDNEGLESERIFSRLRRKNWLVSPLVWAAFVSLFAIAIFILLILPSPAIPFNERDWILITDFENQTGEEIFEKSLNTAFSVSISQSSYINSFPRSRMSQTLQRMKKSDIAKIDEALGREIALREGLRILIAPSISRVGNGYVLSSLIVNPEDGEIYRSEIVQSKNKDKILSAMDKLSKKIRHDLGESIESISSQSKPLSKVTTSSLEALKLYTKGNENHWNANLEEAKMYYRNALQVDSNFTAAKASLGMLLYEKFDKAEGRKYLEAAVKETENLTDQEKYGVLAFYASAVENNLEKAVGYMKMLLTIYPDYYPAHNNLGWYYQQMGRHRDAIAEYKEALRINPNVPFIYNGICWTYLNILGEIDSAMVWIRKQIAYNEQNP